MLVDADACPVKQEIMTVAERHQLPATFVANTYLRLPRHPLFQMKLVSADFDAADDWIFEQANADTIVITADILLAERCLSKGSVVLSNKGDPFTVQNIGSAVATRALMQDLRSSVGEKNNASAGHLGGPAPFSSKDRSRFLSSLHEAIEQLKRKF